MDWEILISFRQFRFSKWIYFKGAGLNFSIPPKFGVAFFLPIILISPTGGGRVLFFKKEGVEVKKKTPPKF